MRDVLIKLIEGIVAIVLFAMLAQCMSDGKIWKVNDSKCESVEK